MSYALGIDLGTTFSAASVFENGRSETLALGYRSPTVPSIIVLREDGEVLVGEAAERRALTDPLRTAREFKRRLGDPTPILLGSTPYSAESLMSYLLQGIYGIVVEQRGEPPHVMAITHPANYGPYKLDLLEQAVRMAEVGEVLFISEPVAAALHYAGRERIEAGEIVAVYDFGGGTFDAALLRRTEDAFEPIGEPEGIERLGGIDFDEAIFRHVATALDGRLGELDLGDPTTLSAVARLRDECREAKEALSVDTDVIIPVVLPNVQADVRLTRAEFEEMVGPRIGETIAALRRAALSAGMQLEEVDKILLVGGTSRIPLVRQRIREATNAQVYLDAHPKHAVALGAAVAAEHGIGRKGGVPKPATTRPAATESEPEPEPVHEPEQRASGIEPEPADEPPVATGEPEPEPTPPSEAATPITSNAPTREFDIPSTPAQQRQEVDENGQPVVRVATRRIPASQAIPGNPPPTDIASSGWLDGIELSGTLIAGLLATMIVSALVVFFALNAIAG